MTEMLPEAVLLASAAAAGAVTVVHLMRLRRLMRDNAPRNLVRQFAVECLFGLAGTMFLLMAWACL